VYFRRLGLENKGIDLEVPGLDLGFVVESLGLSLRVNCQYEQISTDGYEFCLSEINVETLP